MITVAKRTQVEVLNDQYGLTQLSGKVNGQRLFFHARGGHWTLHVGGKDPITTGKQVSGTYQAPDDYNTMPTQEAIDIITTYSKHNERQWKKRSAT